jgi:tetratricopeptide (TPR) repeat protein
LNDKRGIALSSNCAGFIAVLRGDYKVAKTRHEESMTIGSELQSPWIIALSCNGLGSVARCLGDYDTAQSMYERSLEIYRQLQDHWSVASSHFHLGTVSLKRDIASARVHFEESLALRREIGDRNGIAHSLCSLGYLTYCDADHSSARAYYTDSLTLFRSIGNRLGIATVVESFASIAVKDNKSDRAALLWGAAEALRAKIGSPLPPYEREEYARDVAEARHALGDQAFLAAWEQGRNMTMEEAAELALS